MELSIEGGSVLRTIGCGRPGGVTEHLVRVVRPGVPSTVSAHRQATRLLIQTTSTYKSGRKNTFSHRLQETVSPSAGWSRIGRTIMTGAPHCLWKTAGQVSVEIINHVARHKIQSLAKGCGRPFGDCMNTPPQVGLSSRTLLYPNILPPHTFATLTGRARGKYPLTMQQVVRHRATISPEATLHTHGSESLCTSSPIPSMCQAGEAPEVGAGHVVLLAELCQRSMHIASWVSQRAGFQHQSRSIPGQRAQKIRTRCSLPHGKGDGLPGTDGARREHPKLDSGTQTSGSRDLQSTARTLERLKVEVRAPQTPRTGRAGGGAPPPPGPKSSSSNGEVASVAGTVLGAPHHTRPSCTAVVWGWLSCLLPQLETLA